MTEIELLTGPATHTAGSPRAVAEMMNECITALDFYSGEAAEGRGEPGDAAATLEAKARILRLATAARDAGLLNGDTLTSLGEGDAASARTVSVGLWSMGCDCGFCERRRAEGATLFEGRLTNRP